MAKARVEITATNNMQKGLNSAKRDLSVFEKQLASSGSKTAAAFGQIGIAIAAVIGAIKLMTKAMKECISAYSEAEKVSKRLEAVWNNVGQATGKTAKQIDDMAEALEKQTYFTSESIKESALLLAATESLSEEGLDRALQASMDLAAALGEDVTSAANTLAKALEDPEAALNRLKSAGVVFTEEEKTQIKTLSEANQKYEAQAIILDKIEGKYRGVAQAIADTPVGKLDAIKDVWGDIKEGLGEGLVNAISPALDNLYASLLQISDWIAKWGNYWKTYRDEEPIRNYAMTLGSYYYDPHWTDESKASESWQKYFQEALDYLSQFTNEEVEQWINKLTEELANVRPNETLKAFQLQNELWGFQALQQERMQGRYLAPVPATSDSSAYSYTAPADSVLKKILGSYGKSSVEYQRKELTSTIAQVNELIDTLTEGTREQIAQTLEDAGFSGSANSAIRILNDVLADLGEQLEALEEVVEPTELEKVLEQYGKNSNSYQVKNLTALAQNIKGLMDSADAENQVFLSEILENIENDIKGLTTNDGTPVAVKSFLDVFGERLQKWLNPYGDAGTTWSYYGKKFFDVDNEQASAAISTTMNNAIEAFGQAGTLVSELAQNMATMGPVLGAIVTALKYVIEGLAQSIGPMLEEFVTYGLEPLREIGRVIGNLIKPLLEELMPLVSDSAESFMSVINEIAAALRPVISAIATFIRPIIDQLCNSLKIIEPVIRTISKVLVSITGVFEYIGQALVHFVAVILNWLAGLNLFGWKPFEGLRITDPGAPGDFAKFMDARYNGIDTARDSVAMSSATQTAVSSASYRGATSVTINIYQEGPVVGDGGMREFAQMIREEFDALNYYGVTA